MTMKTRSWIRRHTQTKLIIKTTPTKRPKVKATSKPSGRTKVTAQPPANQAPDWVEQLLKLMEGAGDNQKIPPSTTARPATTRPPKTKKGGKSNERRGHRKKNKAQGGADSKATSTELRNGAVRLANSQRSDRGRVEIYINGEWGTVCDDLWNTKAASVVCRQLGFSHVIKASKQAEFGEGRNLRILLDDIDCTGKEKTLLDCKHKEVGKHNCNHQEDAGVICSHTEHYQS